MEFYVTANNFEINNVKKYINKTTKCNINKNIYEKKLRKNILHGI